jgi:hypothetical protein
LYLFLSSTPNPAEDLPDKFWVLNEPDNKTLICESVASVRPNALSLQFSWVTLGLSVSNSKEKDVWLRELRRASEFKVTTVMMSVVFVILATLVAGKRRGRAQELEDNALRRHRLPVRGRGVADGVQLLPAVVHQLLQNPHFRSGGRAVRL